MQPVRLSKKLARWGWVFVIPATSLIFFLSFFPMIQAFFLSLRTGIGRNMQFSGVRNYVRLFQDEIFMGSLRNVFTYFVIEIPIMIFMALVLSSILNYEKLKFKGLFRTIIFLPCVTSLVSSGMIFRSFFSMDGIINIVFLNLGLIKEPVSYLAHPVWAKVSIIVVMLWRWTGYNTIFYLAGMQNIETSVYEAARIDGASTVQQFFRITIPLLKPVILLTTIMSTNGCLQLFDEVRTMTGGGPGIATITLSQYIYDLSFRYNPNFGYAAAVSYIILVLVAFLSFIQLKVGDRA
ncbi:MAG: sugar ABC transporter permease [Treponema sp.]|nr:sugar ABC transporter permease [Treponema sp.]